MNIFHERRPRSVVHQHTAAIARVAVLALGACFLGSGGCGGDDDSGTDEPSGGSSGSAAGSGAGRGGAGAGGSSAAGSSAGSGGSSAGSGGASASSGSKLYGYFNVVMNPAVEDTDTMANTTFLGKLYDGENPTPMAWQKKDEAEGCELDTPNAVLCQPACGSSAVCVSSNNCVPYATAQTAGTLTLKGLGSADIMMDARANNYQLPAGTSLDYPACTAGSKISLAADGGGHGALALEATCISPIEAPASVMLTKGQPLALRWTAPTATGSRMHVLLDISQHGTSKGKIECDTDDDGTLDIPAKLSDALLELGFSGFPTVLLTRESESTPASGNVVLNVSAPYRAAIKIDGLTSCTDDTQCPSGQKCASDLKCMM